jgi:cytochrome c553
MRLLGLVWSGICLSQASAETDDEAQFSKEILPILENHCYECHGDGEHKGKVRFDGFSSISELMDQPELWVHALKNLRSGLMPPAKKDRLPQEDFVKLENWITRSALKLDPSHPDPGRVTLRRLNRTEYHNTIRDLLGVDFPVHEEFPADDTGYGFDNIGDVLSSSSLLLEKYMAAAETIVAEASLQTRDLSKSASMHGRFFTRAEAPLDTNERKSYTVEILRSFTTRAFRRPVDEGTIQRLSELALESMTLPEGNFEKGINRAMVAVLASPRFLFRMEETLPEDDPANHPLLDEYALASRLSYFLWSTMPDEMLYQLAAMGELRKNLPAQIDRMIRDERAGELVKNFAGQWLQSRDVDNVSINGAAVLERDLIKVELPEGESFSFLSSLRILMRREVEMLFSDLLRNNGSLLNLLENDSTYLNEELANHYGVPGVKGEEMRWVKLPPDSPRGGVLTMGATLAVTSNATRTSPVKRGVFILENILGTPPPPPPPNIPSLEASGKTSDGRDKPLREALAQHREMPMCASCHNRMDPLGLVLENFNAMGSWRDRECGQPIESVPGKLITGETFVDVKELKHLLVTARRTDYYRCLTEKMLTYALGRGPEPCDIITTDGIVSELEKSDGKFSTLISGIIHSAPFQRRHRTPP